MKNPATGKNIVDTYHLRLVCDRCMKKEHPESCTHERSKIPKWKSVERLDVSKMFLEGDPATLQRESFGLITENKDSLIPKRDIDSMRARPLYSPNVRVGATNVLITCDPNAGGSCDTALVATVYAYGQMIIVGLDSHSCKTAEDEMSFFKGFIEGLRTHEWLRNSWLMFAGERNTGFESGHMVKQLKKYKHVYAMKEKEDSEYGFNTNNKSKMEYAFSARDRMAEESVFILDDWVCTNPWIENVVERKHKTLEKFYEQMSRYQLIELQQRSVTSASKVTVTGKANAEGKKQAGKQDDLFFTFTMNCGLWEKIKKHQIPTMPYNVLFPRNQ